MALWLFFTKFLFLWGSLTAASLSKDDAIEEMIQKESALILRNEIIGKMDDETLSLHNDKEALIKGSFNGIKSFTVLTRVTPWSLDNVMKKELIKSLGSFGHIESLDSEKAIMKNFSSAMTDTTFLALFIENRIEESNISPLTFKVVVSLSLRCFSGHKENSLDENAFNIIWAEEEFFDFLPNGEKLMNRGTQAIQYLVRQFFEQFKKSNSQIQPTFYVL